LLGNHGLRLASQQRAVFRNRGPLDRFLFLFLTSRKEFRKCFSHQLRALAPGTPLPCEPVNRA
jgi:hypothetical protein